MEVCRIVFYDVYMKLCEERGEKPYPLAIALGAKSNSVVWQWSKGSKPRSDMMMRIADHFNVPVAYLLTGDESLLQKEKPATEVTGKSDRRSYAASFLEDATDEELEKYIAFMEFNRSQRKGNEDEPSNK